ncbi:Transmembrane 9 superfamily member 2 [Cystobasidiomycetes sp. EMM_F5]
MVLLRTVSKDVHRYNAIDLSDDVQEDFGWKLVHAEVFRQPRRHMLLAIFTGSGAQLASMMGVAIFFALLGFLSPSNRGSLSTVMIVCWTLFGVVAGYVSTRLYASLGGQAWKQNMMGTAVLFPTVLFATLNLLNFFLIGANSSGAVPFGTFVSIILLWFGIAVPLTVGGSVYGIKQGSWSHPVRVNQIPRQIPPQIWYLKTIPAALMAGVLPFGAAFIEIYFVLSSMFGSKAFYAFGFLSLTCIVVALTTATVTILMTYFSLCAENWRWHWRAFIIGGGSAFWIVTYGLLYATRLSLDGISSKVLYIGYLFLIALLDFLVTGAIGYLSTYFFLRRIYSQIRVD